MTFSDIVNEISHFCPIRVFSASSQTDISRVRLWADQAEPDMDSILFFGYDGQSNVRPNHYILAVDPADSEFVGLSSDSADIPNERSVSICDCVKEVEQESAVSASNSDGIPNEQSASARNRVKDVDPESEFLTRISLLFRKNTLPLSSTAFRISCQREMRMITCITLWILPTKYEV